MNSLLLIALAAAAVVALIIRRLRGEPLVAGELFGAPVVLSCVGVYSVAKPAGVTVTDVVWVTGGSLLGLVFGLVRGRTVRVFERDGVLWQRYTGATFAGWILSAVVNTGFGFLAVGAGCTPTRGR